MAQATWMFGLARHCQPEEVDTLEGGIGSASPECRGAPTFKFRVARLDM